VGAVTVAREIQELLDGQRRFALAHGDCLDVLRTLPDNCIDSLCTDPPSSIRFMGQTWDTDHGSPLKFSRWLAKRLREAMRVMKPGAHGWVWALPRTSYLTGLACHLAGFQVKDRLHHVFGSGMPHARDISKAVDERVLGSKEAATAARPVIATYRVGGNALTPTDAKGGTYGVGAPNAPSGELTRTTGATDEAKRWDGWHSNLRPGCEDWWLVHKPFDGSIAANALKHGVGGLNIDSGRIPRNWDERGESWKRSGVSAKPDADKIAAPPGQGMILHPGGGWPSNIAFTHSASCEEGGECADDCPVRELNAQGGWRKSGIGTPGKSAPTSSTYGASKVEHRSLQCFGDEGPVSRYFNVFYSQKPGRGEKEAGLGHLSKKSGGAATCRKEGSAGLRNPHAGAGRGGGVANFHPTVKGKKLIDHLLLLATPPGKLVVDLFGGSGTTAVSALGLGFRCLIIEEFSEYLPIIRARVVGDMPLFNQEAIG
jgi:hypothetical protein